MIATILTILLVLIILFIYFKFFKVPKLKNLTFIDGGLGTGKTCMSVRFAIGTYRKQVRNWYIYNFLFWWNRREEYPLLYSNIPIYKYDYVPITKNLIYRKKRFAFKSVLLLDEASLLTDQMDYKDRELSERLTEFFKLFRHETHGGYCIVNSQSISDMHYSFKYCLSDYFYLHSKIRLPFISIVRMQEYAYSSDNNVLQTNGEDVEDNTKLFVIRNAYFKKYDTYTHSYSTDKMKVENKTHYILDRKALKAKKFLTLKEVNFVGDEEVISDLHCPNCGGMLLHHINSDLLTCPYCNYSNKVKVFMKKFEYKKGSEK